MNEQVGIRSAIISKIGEHEVEVRFRPNIVLDGKGIAEVIAERKRICGDVPIGLLLIVPFETELDVAIISSDHQKENQATENILGLAVVAGSVVSEALLRLYKAYYPTKFAAEVFTNEQEARTWLQARIADAIAAN
jgi:hypothetical protein